MRLCLVSREYPPFFGGGIGAYTLRYSRALAAAGHSVVVVTVSDDGRERRERDGEVSVVRLPFIRGHDWSCPHPAIATPGAQAAFETFSPVSVFAMQIAAAMPRLHEEFGFDAVEFPDTGALAWFLLNDRRTGRTWRSGGPPVITTVHSPTAWIAAWNRTPLRSRRDFELAWMERDCAAWSDGLVSPSAALALWAREHWRLPQSAVERITYPLGELEGTARAAADRGAPHPAFDPPGERRIVYAGRLEPRKGVDALIEGFAAAVAKGLDLRLDLAGEDMPDPQRPDRFGRGCIDRLSNPDIRARITLHGKVSPERIGALQQAAAIIAVPAPMDNFPYTCIEAMAHGRLVVAASSGGMAEMIRDGCDGVLFAPASAVECGAALARAAGLNSADAADMGRSAARRILELCGNQTVVDARAAHVSRIRAERRARRAPDGAGCVVINRAGAGEHAVERLREALREAGASFAHGWSSNSGKVRAFSTPTNQSLALAPREIGALVIDASCADRLRDAGLIDRTGDGEASAQSTWLVAMTLASWGLNGVVAPDVLSPVPDDDNARDAAAAELARIHSSRGWRALQRVYDVLHILRGRGLRR